jgi:hypothetical protein
MVAAASSAYEREIEHIGSAHDDPELKAPARPLMAAASPS